MIQLRDTTYTRHWQSVFTDTRDTEERKKGVHRRVYEDELAEALNAGGGNRGRTAVLAFRQTVGRL